ncbi:unnamed protein product [Protopolystoma xenopodis]|uniref:Uncharacterized protein n=1 Tax=Protopolystoma xenopodis TaxID=117903 RepID=A0A3S5FED0_9PLAT|nr:unnamed protein product [Protopolystoma xenopodis]
MKASVPSSSSGFSTGAHSEMSLGGQAHAMSFVPPGLTGPRAWFLMAVAAANTMRLNFRQKQTDIGLLPAAGAASPPSRSSATVALGASRRADSVPIGRQN